MAVMFEEHQGKTKVTLREEVPASIAERNGLARGWSETFDSLVEYLSTI